jgi:probable F420-dependent oxidoreductase
MTVISASAMGDPVARFKVGVSLHPQQATIEEYRAAWRRVDGLGVDSLWVWDHFYPLYGNPDGAHFECWSLLSAMAVDTSSPTIGSLVTCNSYRNPDLLAHIAQTVSLLSRGRLVLGIGAGWSERDYTEYGYEFGTPGRRLASLGRNLPRIRARLSKLNPPVPDLPILIGGAGEKVTLRLVAEHADMWNTFGPPQSYRHKRAVLDQWCERVGRDPSRIERTASIRPPEVEAFEDFLAAGAQHLIVPLGKPFDLGPVERLLAAAR